MDINVNEVNKSQKNDNNKVPRYLNGENSSKQSGSIFDNNYKMPTVIGELEKQNKKLDNGIIIVHSVDELLEYIKRYDDEVMIIGGASVYKEMLEYSDKLILTEIDATHDADVYFPSFNKEEWDSKVVGEQEENNIKYKHLVYTRKNNKNN